MILELRQEFQDRINCLATNRRYVNRMSYSLAENKAILTTGNHILGFLRKLSLEFSDVRKVNNGKKKKQLHHSAFLKFFYNLHTRDTFSRKYYQSLNNNLMCKSSNFSGITKNRIKSKCY